MNGPEHYKEAERLLEHGPHYGRMTTEQWRARVAEAQVHATLALAAATVEMHLSNNWTAWAEAVRDERVR